MTKPRVLAGVLAAAGLLALVARRRPKPQPVHIEERSWPGLAISDEDLEGIIAGLGDGPIPEPAHEHEHIRRLHNQGMPSPHRARQIARTRR